MVVILVNTAGFQGGWNTAEATYLLWEPIKQKGNWINTYK